MAFSVCDRRTVRTTERVAVAGPGMPTAGTGRGFVSAAVLSAGLEQTRVSPFDLLQPLTTRRS